MDSRISINHLNLLWTLFTLTSTLGQTPYPSYVGGPWQGQWYGYYHGNQPYNYGQPGQQNPNLYQFYNQANQPQNPQTYLSNYNQGQNYYPKTYRPVTLPLSFTYQIPNLDHYVKDVTVHTGLGTVNGKFVFLFDGPKVYFHDRPGTPSRPIANVEYMVKAFIGIPYAKAPIGDRRFKPPERYGRLPTFTADHYRPACPQPLITQELAGYQFSEDCLFLNIFAPNTTNRDKYPVLMYIHGGDFESGSGNWFPGHMLAATQSVVVVTFNYRLGALGFLSTGDEASPGNYGMLDQVMAIEWVRDQIIYFDGDPNRITLFGPGAGAASAGLHLISPKTKNIIQRIIAQSGSPLADWAAITNLERARNTSRIFGTKLGCESMSSSRLLGCLKNRNVKELSGFNFKADLGFFPWAPVVDVPNIPEENKFLPDTPRTLFSSRHFNPNIEYLTGVTENEAAYLLLKDSTMIIHEFAVTQEYINRKIKEYILQYNYTLNPDGIYQAMSFMYTYWADPYHPGRIREEYINMMSDALFKAPNDEMVKLMLARNVKMYMYVLNTTVEAFNWESWRAKSHDTEYYFLTGAPFMKAEFFPPDKLADLGQYGYTEEDRQMSSFFMTIYANFAKHGSPTLSQLLGVDWRMMVQRPERTLNYLNINGARNSTLERDYRQRESAFWTNYIPLLIGHPPPTTPLPMEEKLEFQIGFYSAIGAAVLFFLLFLIGCALYCGSSRSRRDYYYDDYSNNHSDMNTINEKNESKYESQQHTTV